MFDLTAPVSGPKVAEPHENRGCRHRVQDSCAWEIEDPSVSAIARGRVRDTFRMLYPRLVTGYAVYTPLGLEDALRRLLPPNFRLVPQCEGDLGERLSRATIDLLDAGHDGVILIGSDSPTLPASILRAAADALRRGDNVVLSPAHDGGYTLVGLSQPHPRLFEGMPWSTAAVYQLTLHRALEIGLPVVNVPGWYDVDDETSLQMLEDEMARKGGTFSGIQGADAPATRAFLRQRRAALITAAGSFGEPHAGHG